jgi:mannose-6-phosphate isomerase-like protein (cupin superfamily)
MNASTLRTVVLSGCAFVAGAAVMHAAGPAGAASAPLMPAAIDIGALAAADLPSTSPTLHARTLAAADGATVGVQIGTVPKHFHADANEIQYVVSGSGTEWLGDKQIPLHAGMLLVIPAGTPHGGTTDANLKLIAIKTPPQASTDTHLLP